MSHQKWSDDQEYLDCVQDLLAQPAVQKLADYPQHHHSTRLDHSISVSYRSFLLGKKWHLNTRALARAGLLHDLFYYDWRVTKFSLGTHAYIHPRIALRNAEKITDLSDMEKDIIIKHMWGATLGMPKYKETVVVSLVDDYAAVDEYLMPELQKVMHPFRRLEHAHQ